MKLNIKFQGEKCKTESVTNYNSIFDIVLTNDPPAWFILILQTYFQNKLPIKYRFPS